MHLDALSRSARDLLGYLAEAGPRTEAVCAAALGWSRRHVRRLVRELRTAGLVAATGANGDWDRPLVPHPSVARTWAKCGPNSTPVWAHITIGTPDKNVRGPRTKMSGVTFLRGEDISSEVAQSYAAKPASGTVLAIPESESQMFDNLSKRERFRQGTDVSEGHWKDRATLAAAAASQRAQDARQRRASRAHAARVARPKKAGGSVALPGELDATPRDQWAFRHLLGHYLRRATDHDPAMRRMRVDALLTDRNRRHLRDLLDYLTNPAWHPDDSLSLAVAAAVDFVDYVFDHAERLTTGLKIRGSLTPAVLWGFRDPILGEMAGRGAIGRSRAAAIDTGETDAAAAGLHSTSEAL